MACYADRCPWCQADILPVITNSGYWDFDYNPSWDSVDKGECPACGKPIEVTVHTWCSYYVDKDEDAVNRELELYEKRMSGDWS